MLRFSRKCCMVVQSETPRPVMVSRSRLGFTLNIIDTPGLVEGGYVNDQVLDTIKSFLGRLLLNKRIDVLIYVDRLDAYRVDNLDKQVVKAITDSFGKEIWHKALVVLTHAQQSALTSGWLGYEEFFSKRSESLLKCVQQGARISKKDTQEGCKSWDRIALKKGLTHVQAYVRDLSASNVGPIKAKIVHPDIPTFC